MLQFIVGSLLIFMLSFQPTFSQVIPISPPVKSKPQPKKQTVENSNCFPSSELLKSLKEKKFIPVIMGEVGIDDPVYGFFSPETNIMLYITVKINLESKSEELACISFVISNYEVRGLGQKL